MPVPLMFIIFSYSIVVSIMQLVNLILLILNDFLNEYVIFQYENDTKYKSKFVTDRCIDVMYYLSQSPYGDLYEIIKLQVYLLYKACRFNY